jgi:hypothetical protein
MAKKKENMFKDAFVNDDKDFIKKVFYNIDGKDIEIARVRYLTQLEVSSILSKLNGNNDITKLEEEKEINVDVQEFVFNLMKESIVEWIFDKEVTIENIKFLKDKYREPIMNKVNELRALWEEKNR